MSFRPKAGDGKCSAYAIRGVDSLESSFTLKDEVMPNILLVIPDSSLLLHPMRKAVAWHLMPLLELRDILHTMGTGEGEQEKRYRAM